MAYLKVTFENIGTKTLVEKLRANHTKALEVLMYDPYWYWLVVDTKLSQVELQGIIHQYNGGAFADVEEVDEDWLDERC